MVGTFTRYFSSDASVTYSTFKDAINTCAWVFSFIFNENPPRLTLQAIPRRSVFHPARPRLCFICEFSGHWDLFSLHHWLTEGYQFGFRTCSMRISAAIRLEYLKCLFAQPVSTLDVIPPGQTAAIITMTATILQTGISEKLSALTQSVSTVVSAFIIAMYYSWTLALVTSSGLVLIIITYAATTPYLVKRLKEVQHADIQSSITASEILGSIRMITAYGAEDKMIRRYATTADESCRRGLKMSPLLAMQQAPSGLDCYQPVTYECTLTSIAVQFAVYR